MFSKYKIFQNLVVVLTSIFMGLMVLVSVVAYSRPSGSTRQDMAKAQFIRYKAVHKQSIKDVAERNEHPK